MDQTPACRDIFIAAAHLDMDKTKIKPSAWFYGLAPLVMIIGIASFVLFILGHLSGVGDSLTRIVVPGKGTVELKATASLAPYSGRFWAVLR